MNEYILQQMKKDMEEVRRKVGYIPAADFNTLIGPIMRVQEAINKLIGEVKTD